MRLLALTFVRTNELRAATWAEVDLDKAGWIIPAARMKTKGPHHVPLSKEDSLQAGPSPSRLSRGASIRNRQSVREPHNGCCEEAGIVGLAL
ncbi:MAG: tyrosine-type recombinase/integrase [Proteobacteria bacterium]|nr:tyrosine-type recombinase/integrase [Pseudomonadota bacterium]